MVRNRRCSNADACAPGRARRSQCSALTGETCAQVVADQRAPPRAAAPRTCTPRCRAGSDPRRAAGARLPPDAPTGVGPLGQKTHRLRLLHDDGKHRHGSVAGNWRPAQVGEPVPDFLPVDIGDRAPREMRQDLLPQIAAVHTERSRLRASTGGRQRSRGTPAPPAGRSGPRCKRGHWTRVTEWVCSAGSRFLDV